MGYLQDFRTRFAKRLEGLNPEEMKAALDEACNAVLESYRNGQKNPRRKAGERGKNNGTHAKRRA